MAWETENNMNGVLSVSDVTDKIKRDLEDDLSLRYVKVRGEISNLSRKPGRFGSDYLYFTLKDDKTQLSAVMFEGVDHIPFEPRSGVQAVCEGMITVYPPYGKYQLKCYSMSEDGAGSAAERLKRLKEKLQAEGLFDQHRPLPRFPKKIAVVTSPTGAALQDIINIIGRRYPICELCVIPASVQGENAVPSIIEGIKKAQDIGADLLIFGRGGGSKEDLDCFNSEPLAREIYASRIPTVSAVGHQIDLTISDLAADLRAPTPSAAAELAVPAVSELLNAIEGLKGTAAVALKRSANDAQYRLTLLEKDIQLYSPLGRISSWEKELFSVKPKITDALNRCFERNERIIADNCGLLDLAVQRKIELSESALQRAVQSVSDLNPMGVMARGYAIAEKDGHVVSDAKSLRPGDEVDVRLGKGGFTAKVIEIKEN